MARGKFINSMVFNKPQLISPEALHSITEYLANPDRAILQVENGYEPQEELLRGNFDSDFEYDRERLQRAGVNPDTKVGVLDVEGTLTYRAGQMNANCTELTSYEGLKRKTEDMLDAGAESIVMMLDSGGGMAYGLFAAANYIKKITKEANVPVTAYVDGGAFSAAYGLAVAADKIIVNPQSQVGSVGVVVALHNDSKMLDNLGITRQFVYAGDNKIPFDKEGEFAETFIADLQKSVDKTYLSFVGHVARNRGLTEQAVIDTQASVYDADDALKLGLIDSIMELEDFELEYGLKTKSKAKNTSPYNLKTTQEDDMSDTQMNNDAMVKLQAELNASQETNKELSEQIAEFKSQLENAQLEVANFKEAAQLEADKREAMELQARKDARQAQLEDALGKDNDKVAKLLESTMSLSDEAFGDYTEALGYSQDKLQASFNEQGDEGDESDIQLSLGAKIAQRLQQK